jgi:N-acetylmuramoyl-L-alanine amidase
VFVSIHLNAGKGKGYEVYTSVGETSSDKIADIWIEKMGIVAPGQVDRGEKDRDFQVLRDTMCPAILTESGFMDTLKDCKWIQSEEGRSAIAKAHLDMMIEVDNHPEL